MHLNLYLQSSIHLWIQLGMHNRHLNCSYKEFPSKTSTGTLHFEQINNLVTSTAVARNYIAGFVFIWQNLGNR